MSNPEWLALISPVLDSGGLYQSGPGIINPWRTIPIHELFIFSDGDAGMTIEDTALQLESPWFVIVPPARRHTSHCLSSRVTVRYSHFDWSRQERTLDQSIAYSREHSRTQRYRFAPGFVPEQILYGAADDRILRDHDRMLEMHYSADPVERMRARPLLLDILLRLLGPGSAGPPRPDTTLSLMERVRSRLTCLAQQSFKAMPPLETELGAFGLSYGHVERLFKKAYRLTPKQYVALVRIETIKNLLIDSRIKVSECAARLGYTDVSYFIRFFRKHTGMSPATYRENMAHSGDRAAR